jgi:hypothetical protein
MPRTLCDGSMSENRRRYHMVGRIKESTPITLLVDQHPEEFKEFFYYTRKLKFQQVNFYF